VAKVDILGVRVDDLAINQAIDQIVALTKQPSAHYVTKPYVEFVEQAYHNHELQNLLNQAELSLPDGVALQWAAAYASGRHGALRLVKSLFAIVLNPSSVKMVLPERFAGVDTTWQLLSRCQTAGLKVFLIGSPVGGNIARTAEVIQERLPELKIVGTAPGSVSGLQGRALFRAVVEGSIDIKPLAKAIAESQADIVLTGAGFPQQDALNAALVKELSHGVLIGEGGSFDYNSFGGHQRRAPGFVRQIGLEWLWRLILQPSRWRRQLAIPRFIWHVYRNY
jgi:N-acetylglucosaminyldiphosphoundecaprenol N-acetyl-beta-D-mannosaminyltransferase